MSTFPYQLLIWAIGLIFAAGGGWALLRQSRKDINGIGARQRKFEKNLLLWLMVVSDNRHDRELLAKLLKE